MAVNKAPGITHSITECSICLQTFKDPRCLPCIHTFCMKCIKQCKAATAITGNTMACPLCKQQCAILQGDIENLPKNVFIEQLLEFNALPQARGDGIQAFCDLCSKVENELVKQCSPATNHCLDCSQNLCESCSTRHTKQKFAMSHRVVSFDEKSNVKRFSQLRVSYCDRHEGEQLKLYCYTCNAVVCLMCFAVQHNGHQCNDIRESSKTFRKELEDTNPKVSECRIGTTNQIRLMAFELNEHSRIIADLERFLDEKCHEFIERIHLQRNSLVMHVRELSQQRLKEIETRRQQLERQLLVANSFVNYSEELLDKGSPWNLSSTAKDLLRRADDIVRSQVTVSSQKLSEFKLTFTSSKIPEDFVLIGKVKLNGQCVTHSVTHQMWQELKLDKEGYSETLSQLCQEQDQCCGEIYDLLIDVQQVLKDDNQNYQAAYSEMRYQRGDDRRSAMMGGGRASRQAIAQLKEQKVDRILEKSSDMQRRLLIFHELWNGTHTAWMNQQQQQLQMCDKVVDWADGKTNEIRKGVVDVVPKVAPRIRANVLDK